MREQAAEWKGRLSCDSVVRELIPRAAQFAHLLRVSRPEEVHVVFSVGGSCEPDGDVGCDRGNEEDGTRRVRVQLQIVQLELSHDKREALGMQLALTQLAERLQRAEVRRASASAGR